MKDWTPAPRIICMRPWQLDIFSEVDEKKKKKKLSRVLQFCKLFFFRKHLPASNIICQWPFLVFSQVSALWLLTDSRFNIWPSVTNLKQSCFSLANPHTLFFCHFETIYYLHNKNQSSTLLFTAERRTRTFLFLFVYQSNIQELPSPSHPPRANPRAFDF